MKIGGSSYIPPTCLIWTQIEEQLDDIWNSTNISELDKSIELMLYISKTQLFWDGNKRTSLQVASFNLINHGIAGGIFIHPNKVSKYKKLLCNYYERNDKDIVLFLKKECIDFTTEFMKSEEYQQIIKSKL